MTTGHPVVVKATAAAFVHCVGSDCSDAIGGISYRPLARSTGCPKNFIRVSSRFKQKAILSSFVKHTCQPALNFPDFPVVHCNLGTLHCTARPNNNKKNHLINSQVALAMCSYILSIYSIVTISQLSVGIWMFLFCSMLFCEQWTFPRFPPWGNLGGI